MVALGIFLHAVGGFAAGSFYLPLKKVRNWAWESYWLINGVFTWVLMPWTAAILTVPALFQILNNAEKSSVLWTFFFGLLWGVGNLTFGLTLRYLGMSLGMAMVLGLTATFGTLIPPIYAGEFGNLITKVSGLTTLSGIVVCLAGIAVCGWAGMSKEKELPEEEKKKYIREFNFKRGIGVALFSGVMSSGFAFAIHAGKPIADLAVTYETPTLWQNSPVLIIIMAGGFITNFSYCMYLNIRNGTIVNYYKKSDAPILSNYLLASIAGITGFMEFMFYSMGTTRMGEHDFSSWSIHMAFIIIFSSMWGLITHEWKGAGGRILLKLFSGLLVLILSTVIIGYGNYLASLGR